MVMNWFLVVSENLMFDPRQKPLTQLRIRVSVGWFGLAHICKGLIERFKWHFWFMCSATRTDTE